MMVFCREGEYARNRIPVTSHVTDIPARLKAIAPGYFVMLNTRTQRFEIHDSAQPGGTLACALPFDALDARALAYARQYHVSRLMETARAVEAHNERLEREAQARLLDRAAEKTREAVAYLKHKTDTDTIPKELIES
ncbi:MAG: hypothetical protein IJ048_12450 [Clostridia bacterium]|nr:hypothetical protein [Clostridia bacterium]